MSQDSYGFQPTDYSRAEMSNAFFGSRYPQQQSGRSARQLSNEELALLNQCRTEQQRTKSSQVFPALRTGPVSIEELMGVNLQPPAEPPRQSAFLQQLKLASGRNPTYDALGPYMPAFSAQHSARGAATPSHSTRSNSSVYRPEPFQTSMQAAFGPQGDTDMLRLLHMLRDAGRNGYQRQERRRPYAEHSPFQPLVPWKWNGPGHGDPFANPSPPRSPSSAELLSIPLQGPKIREGKGRPGHVVSKARKPQDAYMTSSAVDRALKDPKSMLCKGTLRIQGPKLEEAVLEQEDGVEKKDIVIVGIPDRNRAADGDLVVVKIKERDNWLIRGSPYLLWRRRGGAKNKNKFDKAMALEGSGDAGNTKDGHLQYSREDLIKIGVKATKGSSKDKHYRRAMDAQKKALEAVKVLRAPDSEGVGETPLEKLVAAADRPTAQQLFLKDGVLPRRITLRAATELSHDKRPVPDNCLQMTAEVVFVAAPATVNKFLNAGKEQEVPAKPSGAAKRSAAEKVPKQPVGPKPSGGPAVDH